MSLIQNCSVPDMGILRNEPVYRITAGGAAGLTEILLFHPLDVIKE